MEHIIISCLTEMFFFTLFIINLYININNISTINKLIIDKKGVVTTIRLLLSNIEPRKIIINVIRKIIIKILYNFFPIKHYLLKSHCKVLLLLSSLTTKFVINADTSFPLKLLNE